MLVLTRKVQQQIHIGDHITITILRASGQSIRLGIDAPKHVRILRGEIPPHQAVTDSAATKRPDVGHTIQADDTEINAVAIQAMPAQTGRESHHRELPCDRPLGNVLGPIRVDAGMSRQTNTSQADRLAAGISTIRRSCVAS